MTKSDKTEQNGKVGEEKGKSMAKIDQMIEKIRALLPEPKAQKLARKREEATKMDQEAIYINGVPDNNPTQWKKGGGG